MKTAYLQIEDIANGTAETIEGAIVTYVHSNAIPVSNLHAFGGDGAPVKCGRHSGVGARLRSHVPLFVSVHCVNH